MKKVLIFLMFLLLFSSFVSAAITSVSCSGDNLKCYNPKTSGSTLSFDVKESYYAVKVVVDDGSLPVTIKVNDLTTWKNYLDIDKPTLKYTCDNWNWKIVQEKTDMVYEFTPGCKSFKVSEFSGYDYYSVLNNVKKWSEQGIVKVTYETTPKGLKMPIMEFGAENPKYTIVIVSRQHPHESYTSWYMYGLMKQLYKGNPILNDTRFLIFPMANPDGVYYGKVRTNTQNQDLNDCWDKTTCKEVEIMKRYIKSFSDKYGSPDIYLDWHAGDLGNYWTNTINYYTKVERSLGYFLKDYTSYDAISFVDFEEGSSREYIHTLYNEIAITPEIQMNNDANTPDKMMIEGGKFPKILHDWLVVNR